MKRSLMMTACLATIMATASAAQTPSRGIEEDYYNWQSIKLDPAGGAAFFVTYAERAGNAVQFRMLAVYRDERREGEVRYDKEMFTLLGDCGSRMLLTTGYRYQRGTEFIPPPIIAAPVADVPSEVSIRGLALAAVCRPDGAPGEWTKTPYSWAKQRLREGRP